MAPTMMCSLSLIRKVACPLVLIGALVLGGCVTKETYSAQVIRTNNFQRQLAEEEKHSADLAAEIVRLKIQIAELEAQNRTLTTQLNEAKAQVVRSLEEVGRLQAEIKQARAASLAPTGAAVVVLIGHSDQGGNGSGGTGWLIRRDGLVLTSAHVVIEEKTGRPYPRLSVFLKPDRVTGNPKTDLAQRVRASVVAFDRTID